MEEKGQEGDHQLSLTMCPPPQLQMAPRKPAENCDDDYDDNNDDDEGVWERMITMMMPGSPPPQLQMAPRIPADHHNDDDDDDEREDD